MPAWLGLTALGVWQLVVDLHLQVRERGETFQRQELLTR